MSDHIERLITVIGFGARGARSIAMLRNSPLSHIQYEVIDASLEDDTNESNLFNSIVQRFSDISLLILLIDNLSPAEARTAVQLGSMNTAEPYFLIAIAPNNSDIDFFKAQANQHSKLKVGAFICLQQEARETAGHNSATDDGYSLDDRICDSIRGITEPVLKQGLICIDLADIRCTLSMPGIVHFGVGCSQAANKELLAVQMSIGSMPDGLSKLRNARGAIICVQGGKNLGLKQWSEMCDLVEKHVQENCTVTAGSIIDPAFGDKIKIYLYVLS